MTQGRVLVVGDVGRRAALAERLQALLPAAVEVDDGDPDYGDVVMYLRLEGARYGVVVFVGWADPVTRGGLALVAEKAVLIPLLEPGEMVDAKIHGYLFRLPRGLGFRGEDERARLLEAVPKAGDVPAVTLGGELADGEALTALLRHTTEGAWAYEGFEPDQG